VAPRVGLTCNWGQARCPSNTVCLHSFPPQHGLFSRFHCAAPAKSRITHISASRSAHSPSSASIRVGFRVLRGKFFSTRLWGVHLASLEVRFWRVGRGSQASLPARSKHTTYPSCFPQHTPWCTTSLALSHPQFSCTLQLDLTPSTQSPLQSRSKGSSRSCPSRHVTIAAALSERVRSASIREHQPWFCPTTATALDALVLSASAPCTRAFTPFAGPLLIHQTVYQNKPSSAITPCTYTRAPGYLSSFDQHT
jgi:hypothetical protein